MTRQKSPREDAAEHAWSLLLSPQMQTGWQGVSQDYAGNKLLLPSLIATGRDDDFFTLREMGREMIGYRTYLQKIFDDPFAQRFLPHADDRYEFVDTMTKIEPVEKFNQLTTHLKTLVETPTRTSGITSDVRQSVRSLVAQSTFWAYGPQQVFKEGWHIHPYVPVRGAPPGPLAIAGYDADYGRHLLGPVASPAIPVYEDHLRGRLERLDDRDRLVQEILRKDFAAAVQRESADLRRLVLHDADKGAVAEQYARVRTAFFGWFEGTKLAKLQREPVTP